MTSTGNLITNMRKLGSIYRDIKDGKEVKLTPGMVSTNNIITLNKIFMVRPRLIISDKFKYMDQSTLKSIVDTQLKIFTSNYLQAFSVLTNVYGLDTRTSLHMLNNTNALGGGSYTISGNESDDDYYRELYENNNKPFILAGYESTSVKNNDDLIKFNQLFITTYELETSVMVPGTTDKNGESKDINKVIKIPLTIYPDIRFTNSDSLIDGLIDGEDKSFFARLDEFRSGAISLTDLVFATDLVKKYKNKQIKNNNDIVKYLRGINTTATINTLITSKNNYAVNYNMYILDVSDKLKIEEYIKGKFTNEKYKNKMLDEMLAFSTTIIDVDKELVSIFLSGIPSFTVLNFKMLKKDKDMDINEIFQKLLTNKSPF